MLYPIIIIKQKLRFDFSKFLKVYKCVKYGKYLVKCTQDAMYENKYIEVY